MIENIIVFVTGILVGSYWMDRLITYIKKKRGFNPLKPVIIRINQDGIAFDYSNVRRKLIITRPWFKKPGWIKITGYSVEDIIKDRLKRNEEKGSWWDEYELKPVKDDENE
jgi:hypothetical protein